MGDEQSGNNIEHDDEELTPAEKQQEEKRLRVTSFDALLLNFKEYRKRVWRLIKYAIAMAVVCSLIVFLAGVIAGSFVGSHNIHNAFFSSIATATGTAYPVNIDSDGVHATITEEGTTSGTDEASGADNQQQNVTKESMRSVGDEGKATPEQNGDVDFNIALFLVCVAEVVLIGFVVTTLSGAFAGVFLKPINCIKSAPVMVVRQKKYAEKDIRWVLSARIWIALPHGQYLYNGSVSANIYFNDRYIQSTFTMCADDMRYHIDRQEFTMLNGVWSVDIPLDAHVHGEGGTITEVFQKLMKPNGEGGSSGNPGIQIIVQGRTPSGEIISHIKTYHSVDILPGYGFAPYQWKTQKQLVESLKGKFEKPKRGKLRDYAGFFKVVEKPEEVGELSKDERASTWAEMCGVMRLVQGSVEELDGRGVDSKLREKRRMILEKFCKNPMDWDADKYLRNPRLAFRNLRVINQLDTLTGHGYADAQIEKRQGA